MIETPRPHIDLWAYATAIVEDGAVVVAPRSTFSRKIDAEGLHDYIAHA